MHVKKFIQENPDPTGRAGTEIKMAGSNELWVQCFTCCLTQQRGTRTRNPGRPQHQRLRIDRSMIGMPTDFRHTAHISSGDIDMSISQLSNIQAQMQRKGGYNINFGTKVRLQKKKKIREGCSLLH